MPYADQITLDEEIGTARKALFDRLVVLARELLANDADREDPETGSYGVTFYDVRVCAETRGWLNGEEKQPVLSFGSRVMSKAGGIASGYRRTKQEKSHRRMLVVYRLQTVVRRPPP